MVVSPLVRSGSPSVNLAPHNPGTIAVSSAVMFAAALYPLIKGGQKPSGAKVWKRVWAIMVLSLVLAAADDFAPQVTGPFALSLIVGTFALSGWFGVGQAPAPSSSPPGTMPHH